MSGVSVTGRVLLNGKPMPYYGLALNSRDSRVDRGRTAIREPDGRFTLSNVEPGTWRIQLVGPGARLKVSDEFTVERGDVDLGDIVMEPGPRIVGHVRDRSGAPVSGAHVTVGLGPGLPFSDVLSPLEQWMNGCYETTTDSSGGYVFDGTAAPSGPREHRLIWATHGSNGVSLVRELPRETSTLDFELLGSGRIEGVVEGVRGGRPLVLAKRADEPEHARVKVAGEAGAFRFDDLPPGDYVISLKVPTSVQTSSVNVTVVDGQAASTKLVMVTSSVRLTVKVPQGRGKDLVLASADDSTPEPEQLRPRIVMIETRITMVGRPSPPWSGKESVAYDHLQPGKYRASIDGTTWTPIVVTSSPDEQSVEITALD